MKVAIIDSGINPLVFPDIDCKQYRVYNGEIFQEEPKDYLGHGTAVASVALKGISDIELISICPGINESGIPDRIISIEDLVKSLEKAIIEGSSIINISMGSTEFSKREQIDLICKKAKDNGVLIVASEATNGYPSLPWSCNGVLRVRCTNQIPENIIIGKNQIGVDSIIVQHGAFRIITKENKKFFATGNSYASPYVVNMILKAKCSINEEMICSALGISKRKKNRIIKMLNQNIPIFTKNISSIKEKTTKNKERIILLPFNKEMHSILRFNRLFNYEVICVVDPIKKGPIKKYTPELDDTVDDIPIYNCLGANRNKADTLIIGHVDRLKRFGDRFNLYSILEENLNNTKMNVFSFIPVQNEWVEKYSQSGLTITFPPIIDKKMFNSINLIVRNNYPIAKPVVGVFGTSSAQGKLTLQVLLKLGLEALNYKCFFLSTENHAQLFDADYVVADGYGNNSTMKLDADSKSQFLKKLMVYIDNTSKADLILTGGQSRLIPFDISTHTFLRSASFLEGVCPDLAIVVINPLIDPKEYIEDTIIALKAVYKCRTVALAFSDYSVNHDEKGRLFYEKLSEKTRNEISQRTEELFNIPCGCINDKWFVGLVTKIIIDSCK